MWSVGAFNSITITPPSASFAVNKVPINTPTSLHLHYFCRPLRPLPSFSLSYHSSFGPQLSYKRTFSFRCSAALTPELKNTLDKVVTSHKVVLFMKGTRDFPQCGFSNTVVQILKSLNVPFETINILENELLRQGLKEYSSWPTFPQLYVEGEFFGGCDITVEAYKTGELQELLEKAMCS
ncbi:PREDICTED: monothiol [Prunus dulcis]|uniref:PREDICTED: monothiol n=1 Tax=Prunus dulcis TaxID=3755 RepID=A0A5E4ECD8_PRUDU|nr:monothiol glutaredoxin-S14, chloroplastic-like [Prunus dulcis]VVA13096.1 PREDICTED: monothiol [Prunus dulcis]